MLRTLGVLTRWHTVRESERAVNRPGTEATGSKINAINILQLEYLTDFVARRKDIETMGSLRMYPEGQALVLDYYRRAT